MILQISVMKSDLQDLQPMLVSRSQETAALAKIIESESIEVEQVRKVVEKDEAAATEAAMGSKAIKVCVLLMSVKIIGKEVAAET